MHQDNIEFQSYFWLYAPAGEVILKKPKKTSLPAIFDRHAAGNNPVSCLLSQPSNLVPTHHRHLTIFEQPRSPSKDEPGVARYQPIQSTEQLVEIVGVMQDIASDYMPLRYGAKGLEIFEKTNKVQMALNLNDEAKEQFTEFHDDLMTVLAEEFRVYDFYRDSRVPRVILSKGYKSDLPGKIRHEKAAIRTAMDSFNECQSSVTSKPIEFSKLIFGQGLYDPRGNRLASRQVATIHFDGQLFDWHCDDPLNVDENAELIAETTRRRAQAKADGQRFPSLAA